MQYDTVQQIKLSFTALPLSFLPAQNHSQKTHLKNNFLTEYLFKIEIIIREEYEM